MSASRRPWSASVLSSLITSLLPSQLPVSQRERLRAAGGAMLGILATGLVSAWLVDSPVTALWLMAPMGASAVLLFGVPSSPLAQPWSIIGGNVVSALIGVACGKFLGAPLAAATAAIFLAMAAMFTLRCLHPPGGAVALTATLSGADIHAQGFAFVLAPVLLNSALLLMVAVLYNNLTRRRYPHVAVRDGGHPHRTSDLTPQARLGFTSADLQAALRSYDQVFDVDLNDLESLFRRTEMNALQRRLGETQAGTLMSRDVQTVEFATELGDAWALMQRHALHALPVIDRARHVIGIVTQADFLRHVDPLDSAPLGERLRALLERVTQSHTDRHSVVGQIMSNRVITAAVTMPAAELIALMNAAGHHHVPIVDAQRHLVGIVTQTDVVATLCALSESPAP